MNLKTNLITALLVVILMSLMSFGYITYAIYSESASKTGADHLKDKQLLFYVQMVLSLLSFGLGVGIFFKAEVAD